MDGLVITAQIYPGKLEAWRRFWQDLLGNRRQEFQRACRRHGISSHQVCLMKSSQGYTAVLLLEVNQPHQTLSELITSTHPFDRWFKRQFEDLHTLSFSSSAKQNIESVAELQINNP